ncbi:MAG: PAS domain S-box protein [Promethearchaeota archaeon]|jgi:PAS domain S-box-containing protein
MLLESILSRHDVPEDVKNAIKKEIADRERKEKEYSNLKSLFNHSPETSMLLDHDGRIITINRIGSERLGKSKEELKGEVIFDFFPPPVANLRKSMTEEALVKKKNVRYSDSREGIAYENWVYPILDSQGEVVRLAIFANDITNIIEANKALVESEERYRTLITTMGEGVWLVIKQRLEEKKHSSTYELTWIKKDGSSCITRVAGTFLLDEEGRITGSFGVFTDITMEKRIEQSLQESEEKYRILVERANDGITIIQDTLLKYVNQSLSEITGYSIPELLEKPFTSFLHPNVLEEVGDFYRRRMAGEDVRPVYDTVMRRKDGSSLDVEINAGLITFQGRPANLVFVRNISERKRTEKLLKQIKVEEERYYAMLAHFMNNDLQKIVNNLDFLLLELEKSGTIKIGGIQRTINIATQSSRTIDTVNQIFDVLQSPSTNESKECINLLDKITWTVNNIFNFKECVQIDENSLDKLLICDKYFTSALSEILNFIQYSCEENVLVHSPIKIEGSLLAAYYRIVVTDNCSPPISEEVSHRLSSKITDNWEYQGHYIGLALSSVIMQHYGGALKIFPIADKGNEFQLQFPSILVSNK